MTLTDFVVRGLPVPTPTDAWRVPLRLRYGALLLMLLEREIRLAGWASHMPSLVDAERPDRIEELCDRFERTQGRLASHRT